MPASRRRLRRFAKYTGVVLSSVIFVVASTSWWREVRLWGSLPQNEFTESGVLRWLGPARYCFVETGTLTYRRTPRRSVWDGTPELGSDGRLASDVHFVVPLWIPFLLLATSTALLFYLDRRTRRGHCLKCRYDLAGNTTGICPECGHAVANNQA